MCHGLLLFSSDVKCFFSLEHDMNDACRVYEANTTTVQS